MLTNFAIGTAMLLAATTAVAQQPVIPDDATKARALKRAYQLNGNSMVGYDLTIDLSGGIPPDDAKCHMVEGTIIGQKFFECDEPSPPMPPSPFKNPPEDLTSQTWDKAPARVQVDIVNPGKFNEIDAMTSVHMDNVCKRHGLRKVVTENGKSWKCQK